MATKAKSLIVTHDHCALHGTRQISPERPKRIKWVMRAIEANLMLGSNSSHADENVTRPAAAFEPRSLDFSSPVA